MRNELIQFKQNIALYAFRYALGRTSYAASEVASYLIQHKKMFTDGFRNIIISEIDFAIKEGLAGMDFDIVQWKQVIIEFKKLDEK